MSKRLTTTELEAKLRASGIDDDQVINTALRKARASGTVTDDAFDADAFREEMAGVLDEATIEDMVSTRLEKARSVQFDLSEFDALEWDLTALEKARRGELLDLPEEDYLAHDLEVFFPEASPEQGTALYKAMMSFATASDSIADSTLEGTRTLARAQQLNMRATRALLEQSADMAARLEAMSERYERMEKALRIPELPRAQRTRSLEVVDSPHDTDLDNDFGLYDQVLAKAKSVQRSSDNPNRQHEMGELITLLQAGADPSELAEQFDINVSA